MAGALGHGSIAVGFHHAFEGAFETFAHAVAVAHDAFHDAELAHVAGHELCHALVEYGQLFFVFGNLGGGAFALGVDQAGRQQHFLDAVDGSACQACRGWAVDALVVGARAEHGGDFAKVVLQGGTTMTGQPRDTVEIEPVLKTRPNSQKQ